MNQSTEARQDNISELSQVNEAMALISDEHRTVLICICIKGMKYNEVATMLAIPIGTVRSRLSRAREQLQEALIQRAANKIYSSPSSLPAIIQKAA